MGKLSVERFVPNTIEEYDYYDEFDYGFKTWQERWENWLKWKKTNEGKRAIKKYNEKWLKKYG